MRISPFYAVILLGCQLVRADSTNTNAAPVVIGTPRNVPVATTSTPETWTTTDGKTYQDVKVIKVEDDAVTILYRDGGTAIPWENLPVDIQKRNGHDPDKIAAAQKAQQDADAAAQKAQQDTDASIQKAQQDTDASIQKALQDADAAVQKEQQAKDAAKEVTGEILVGLLLLAWIAAWIAGAIVIASFAHRKGNSPITAFFLTLVFSPLIGLILVALSTTDEAVLEKRKLAAGVLKRCPACAEFIKGDARVCRYCGQEVK